MRSRFVVDIMLGRLARWLRTMGYDTLYLGQGEDRHLLRLARAQARILSPATACWHGWPSHAAA